MKTTEEIELEYEEYDVDLNVCENIDDLYEDIINTSKDIEDDKLEVLKAIKENTKDKLFDKIFMVLHLIEDIDLSYYDDDIQILNEEFDLILIYKYYLSKLMNIANEENFKEVYKLLFYMMAVAYENNIAYLEYKRDMIYYKTKGINYCNSKFVDSFDAFKKFFDEKIKELSLLTPIVKAKNI